MPDRRGFLGAVAGWFSWAFLPKVPVAPSTFWAQLGPSMEAARRIEHRFKWLKIVSVYTVGRDGKVVYCYKRNA